MGTARLDYGNPTGSKPIPTGVHHNERTSGNNEVDLQSVGVAVAANATAGENFSEINELDRLYAQVQPFKDSAKHYSSSPPVITYKLLSRKGFYVGQGSLVVPS